MTRCLFAALAFTFATGAVAHGQTPSPPAPTYPSITVTGTLPAGTYRLVPAGEAKAPDRAAAIAKVRAFAQALLDATAPEPTPPVPPQPKPDPKPEPKPDPQPPAPPAPVNVGKVWVVVVETPAGAPTRGQLFADPALTAYAKIKGHRFRIIDANVRDAGGKTPADVAPYIALAAGKALPQAFIVDAAGHLLYSGTLPATADALVALLKKVGG